MKKCYWILLLLSFVTSPLSAQKPTFITDSLDAYIKKGMADWRIPGLAVAVVKDGKILFVKGYGVKEVGTSSPVDENTLFPIASNTKLFTGTALALLDEQKKLSLNDKVTKYLPDYQLFDPTATKLVTIRDLLSHRLGTKDFQGDFLFWDTNLTRQDVVYRMRLLAPPNEFRQDFGYSNQGYVTAAEIIPKVIGKTWEQLVDSSMLKPLNMTRTYMLTTGIDRRPNVAQPYTTCCTAEGKLTKIPFDNLDNLGPASSMVSSASDMAKWLMMQLDSGRLEGKRVMPWSVLDKTRTANTIVSSNRMTAFPVGFQFYCLGMGLLDYAGYSVYAHAGACSGFKSNTTLVPEENLGIVILTNQDNNLFHEALRFQLLDTFLKVPYTNRHQYYFNRASIRDQKNRDEIKMLAQRVDKKVKLPLKLSAYTGIYKNELYGTLTIVSDARNEGTPEMKIRFEHHPNLVAQLDYMDGNEFRLTFSNPRFGIFPTTFTLLKNRIEHLELKGTEFVDHDSYVFKRISP